MKQTVYQGIEERHLALVRGIARSFIVKLPANVELNDLVQVGSIGLLEAMKNYVVPSEASFETFAASRISGAILDHLREEDWLSRGDRRWLKRIEAASRDVEGVKGGKAQPKDIADALGISLDEYFSRHGAAGISFISIDVEQDDSSPYAETIEDPNSPDPLHILSNNSTQSLLNQAIERLPERERRVVELHTQQEITLKRIGDILGVHESRVCQIFGRAVRRCQQFFKSHGYDISDHDDPIPLKGSTETQNGNTTLNTNNLSQTWGRFVCPKTFSIGTPTTLYVPYNLAALLGQKNRTTTPNNPNKSLEKSDRFSRKTEHTGNRRFNLPSDFQIVSSRRLALPVDFLSVIQSGLNIDEQVEQLQVGPPVLVVNPPMAGGRFSLPQEFSVVSSKPFTIPVGFVGKVINGSLYL